MSISDQGRALSAIADEIDTLDNMMKTHAESLLFLMRKKDTLTMFLKQLAKELV